MNDDLISELRRIADALEGINAELEKFNGEGIVVFAGETIEEN